MKPIQVGLLGIGTVGRGTFEVLQRNQEEIQRRAGRGIEISMVADLDTARAQAAVGPSVKVVNDARAIIANPDIDIVIELIGGYGIAKALVMEAIAAGKHVVTANKALLSAHGPELFALAAKHQTNLYYEAAVAGGIPIIKALREGLSANRIEWIAGTGEKGDGPEGPALACRLARLHGIFADADGGIYLGDSEAHRLRVIRPARP